MKDNKTKRCDVLNLLKKIIQEGYSPNDEELKIIGGLRNDIKHFIDHCDDADYNVNKQSPFFYINILNKLASRNYVYEGVDLAQLSLLLKKIHGERYGFTPSILDKDSEGHFVTCRDTREGLKLQPIEMSLSGYLDAFVEKVFEYHRALEKINER